MVVSEMSSSAFLCTRSATSRSAARSRTNDSRIAATCASSSRTLSRDAASASESFETFLSPLRFSAREGSPAASAIEASGSPAEDPPAAAVAGGDARASSRRYWGEDLGGKRCAVDRYAAGFPAGVGIGRRRSGLGVDGVTEPSACLRGIPCFAAALANARMASRLAISSAESARPDVAGAGAGVDGSDAGTPTRPGSESPGRALGGGVPRTPASTTRAVGRFARTATRVGSSGSRAAPTPRYAGLGRSPGVAERVGEVNPTLAGVREPWCSSSIVLSFVEGLQRFGIVVTSNLSIRTMARRRAERPPIRVRDAFRAETPRVEAKRPDARAACGIVPRASFV